jgi:hypothetical protein
MSMTPQIAASTADAARFLHSTANKIRLSLPGALAMLRMGAMTTRTYGSA